VLIPYGVRMEVAKNFAETEEGHLFNSIVDDIASGFCPDCGEYVEPSVLNHPRTYFQYAQTGRCFPCQEKA